MEIVLKIRDSAIALKLMLLSPMANYYAQFAVQLAPSPSIEKKRQKRRKSLSSKYVADYAKPVNFVNAGVVLPNLENDLENDRSFRSDLGGLRSSASSESEIRVNNICGCANIEDKNDVDSCSCDLLPIVSGPRKRADAVLCNMGSSHMNNAIGGIGRTLLEKMGYNGGGLGKTQQGILVPIQVEMRPKNMGMGYKEKAPVSVVHHNRNPSEGKCAKKRKESLMAAKELDILNPEEDYAPNQPISGMSIGYKEKAPLLMDHQNMNPGQGKRWLKRQKAKERKKARLAAYEVKVSHPEEEYAPNQQMFDMRTLQVRAMSNIEDNNNTMEKAPVLVDRQKINPRKVKRWMKKQRAKKSLMTAKELEISNPEGGYAPSEQMFDMQQSKVSVVTNGTVDKTEEKAPALVDLLNINPGKVKCWVKNQRAKKDILATKELEISHTEEEHSPRKQLFDMRQSQVRALTNVADNNTEGNALDYDRPVPKLLRLTAQLAEYDTQKIVSYLRNERVRVVVLQKQRDKLSPDLAQRKKLRQNIDDIVSVLDLIIDENSRGTLTLDLLAMYFSEIQRNHPEYYKFFESSVVTRSFALPSLSTVFQCWDPLQNPSHGLELIAVWKDILLSQREYNLESEDLSSLYPQLIVEVVVPALRTSVISKWDVLCPDPLVEFMEMWEKLIPPSVLKTILDEIIFPKLASAVDRWNPREANVPIHSWIHPWLRLLSCKLETLYPIIQKKFGNILHWWHPGDESAYTMLSPWKNVFGAESWESLMVCFIVPKLQFVMQDFLINPEDQKLDYFYWVISWASVVPLHYMVTLLQVFLLEKWQTVRDWLFSNLHFKEIIQWYNGWKKLLPPALLQMSG